MTTHLRSKILAALILVAVALLAATAWIHESVLLPSFVALERQQATRNLDRGTEALQNELEHVSDFVGDWSGWDDTYKYIADGNAEYAKSNLETDVFREDSFDFLCYLRPDGTEQWRGGLIDGEQPDLAELPAGRWPLDHPLLATPTLQDVRTTIVVTKHGPLLMASRPITDSARTALQRGWIMMGRFLSDDRIAKLATQTRLQLRIVPARDLVALEDRAASMRLRHGEGQELRIVDDHRLVAAALVPGLEPSRDDLFVEVSLPRAILAEGRNALRFALLTNTIAVLFVFGVLMWLLQRIVVGPLGMLTRHALRIRASDDLTVRCKDSRRDEIGVLGREFDNMVERLATSQSLLLERAREGGMAEVARSVLHDVGNALQAVHANSDLLRRHLGSRMVADLQRISGLLAAHAGDLQQWLTTDPRGQRVPEFLVELATGLATEHGTMAREVEQLTAGLDHIDHLVARQREHSAKGGAREVVDPGALFAEAARIGCGVADRGVTCEIRVTATRPLRVEKHKLLAVLINLVRNAREAVSSMPQSRRTIRFTAADEGGDRILLTVADDGVGIAADDLTRIFQGGLSTKTGGGGIGLHGCANSVRELGGRLWAESEGLDRGARFCIELPARAPSEVAEWL